MLDVRAAATQDLTALSPAELAELATQMLTHIGEQSKLIASQAQAIKWRDAKIQSITFQLARLKAWKFGAKSERMNAAQREIFERDAGRRPARSKRLAVPPCPRGRWQATA